MFLTVLGYGFDVVLQGGLYGHPSHQRRLPMKVAGKGITASVLCSISAMYICGRQAVMKWTARKCVMNLVQHASMLILLVGLNAVLRVGRPGNVLP